MSGDDGGGRHGGRVLCLCMRREELEYLEDRRAGGPLYVCPEVLRRLLGKFGHLGEERADVCLPPPLDGSVRPIITP